MIKDRKEKSTYSQLLSDQKIKHTKFAIENVCLLLDLYKELASTALNKIKRQDDTSWFVSHQVNVC